MWRTAHVPPLVYVWVCACVCQCANGICKIANCRSRCGPLYAFLPSSLPYQFTINASVNMFKKVAIWCCMRLTQMIVIRIERHSAMLVWIPCHPFPFTIARPFTSSSPSSSPLMNVVTIVYIVQMEFCIVIEINIRQLHFVYCV